MLSHRFASRMPFRPRSGGGHESARGCPRPRLPLCCRHAQPHARESRCVLSCLLARPQPLLDSAQWPAKDDAHLSNNQPLGSQDSLLATFLNISISSSNVQRETDRGSFGSELSFRFCACVAPLQGRGRGRGARPPSRVESRRVARSHRGPLCAAFNWAASERGERARRGRGDRFRRSLRED